MNTRATSQKVRPLWRLVAGVFALAIFAFQFVGYQVARSINLDYFKDPSVPISALDIASFLIALYFLIIAATGLWRFGRIRS